jgi:hypothetical protein
MTRGTAGIIAALAAFALIFSGAAFADVGYYVNRGSAPFPEAEDGEPDIRMAAEEVTITLRDHYVDVEATFDFVNDGEEGRTVGMYFPLNVGTLELTAEAAKVYHDPEIDSYGYDLPPDRVKSSFKALVDGVPAGVKLRDLYCDSDGFFDEVYGNAVWEVSFEPGETKKVDCSYSCYYSSGYIPYSSGGFFYILYTGTGWKGPIGRGIVMIRPGDGFDWRRPLSARGVAMPPMRIYDDRIEWRFDNFEPVTPEIESYTGLGTGSGVTVSAPPTREYLPEDTPPDSGTIIAHAVEDVPLYKKPSVSAEPADGWGFIAEGDMAEVLERRGEWYRVKYVYGDGGTVEGWARWYEYDEKAGEGRYSLDGLSLCY